MTQIAHLVRDGFVEAPDILVGGTPCQAFSVAGLRNSLEDHRGQLTLSFVDLANAIDTTRLLRGERESIILWENVPGVLNTKDNAFGCFLGALAGEDEALQPAGGKWTNSGCVFGPQRTIVWRVLDAQYFGVAQRRRRVFVVASARKDINTAEILFEFDGVRRDIAPSRESRQEITGTLGARAANGEPGHGARSGDSKDELIVPVISKCLTRTSAGGVNLDYETSDFIACHSMPKTPSHEIIPTLETTCNDYSRADGFVAVAYGISGNWINRAPENGGNATDPMNDIAQCLTKTDRHGVCAPIGFDSRQDCISSTDVFGSLSSSTPQSQAVAFGVGESPDLAHCQRSGASKADKHESTTYIKEPSMQVRRLTPVECERLQGFPDNYTLIPVRGKPAADGPRYKALGNSMAVPVIRHIGIQINHIIKNN
jgi:DNA (cytosine-5)-methyltransferase 1